MQVRQAWRDLKYVAADGAMRWVLQGAHQGHVPSQWMACEAFGELACAIAEAVKQIGTDEQLARKLAPLLLGWQQAARHAEAEEILWAQRAGARVCLYAESALVSFLRTRSCSCCCSWV